MLPSKTKTKFVSIKYHFFVHLELKMDPKDQNWYLGKRGVMNDEYH